LAIDPFSAIKIAYKHLLRTLNSKEQWVSEWFSIEKNTWLEVVIEDFNDYEIFSLKNILVLIQRQSLFVFFLSF
jgi:hypothetical protein